MATGLLIAAFGTPSRGVSPLVLYFACLPFILGGMASALHCCGHASRTAHAVFLSAISILLFVTAYGIEPGVRACTEWMYSFELPESSVGRCNWVAAALFGALWLGLGVAFFAYVYRSPRN